MSWEAPKSWVLQERRVDFIGRRQPVFGSLSRWQSAKSPPWRRLSAQYASEETRVRYSFPSQLQLWLSKLTLYLPLLSSDRGIASTFFFFKLKCSFLTNSFFGDFSITDAKDMISTLQKMAPANQCLSLRTAVSASNTYLSTVSFCQQCHAEFIVNVRELMSGGNVCVSEREREREEGQLYACTSLSESVFRRFAAP